MLCFFMNRYPRVTIRSPMFKKASFVAVRIKTVLPNTIVIAYISTKFYHTASFQLALEHLATSV